MPTATTRIRPSPRFTRETRQAQIEDWVMDLREYGSEAISRACGRWRITQRNRPTPADIVKLAIEERNLIEVSEEGVVAGKKPYANMTEGEKLAWHTDVYAFRQVVLGVSPDEHTSPCDTKGRWYRADLVEAEVLRRRPRRDYRQMELEGREISERWAREQGFESMEAYVDARGITWAQACTIVSTDILSKAAAARARELAQR